MADAPRSPTNLEDTSLVAFMLLQGHKLKEYRCQEDPFRVSFDILGDEKQIAADMELYYDKEEMVSITEFVKCLREVKSRLYNFKKLNK
jgi:hypothetical protein